MFKIGDNIDYGFYPGIKIVGKDEKHFIVKNLIGQEKKIYIDLIEAHATLISSPEDVFLAEYADLCTKHGVFINTHVAEPRLEPTPKDDDCDDVDKSNWQTAFARSIIRLHKTIKSA